MSESAEIDGASQMIMLESSCPDFSDNRSLHRIQRGWILEQLVRCYDHLQKSKDLGTLQYLLREILAHAVLTEDQLKEFAVDPTQVYTEGLKMAALMVTILPIIVVYPFVQRHFMSGVWSAPSRADRFCGIDSIDVSSAYPA